MGVNLHVLSDFAKPRLVALSPDFVRLDQPWGWFGQNRATLDAFCQGSGNRGDIGINWLNGKGIGVIALLKPDGHAISNIQDIRDYAAFCGNFAAHYRGKIAAYEIGNEGGGVAESRRPELWPELLTASARAIRQNDPEANIIVDPGSRYGCRPGDPATWQYRTLINGVVDHCYLRRDWPSRSVEQELEKWVTKPYGLAGASLTYELSERIKRPLDLWVTEFGYSTFDRGFSESAQAERLIEQIIVQWRMGIERQVIFDLQDTWRSVSPEINRGNIEANWGLLASDGREKPAFACLKRFLAFIRSDKWHISQTAPPLLIEKDPFSLDQVAIESSTQWAYFVWRRTDIHESPDPQKMYWLRLGIRGTPQIYRLVNNEAQGIQEAPHLHQGVTRFPLLIGSAPELIVVPKAGGFTAEPAGAWTDSSRESLALNSGRLFSQLWDAVRLHFRRFAFWARGGVWVGKCGCIADQPVKS